jgi:hypothetical protein
MGNGLAFWTYCILAALNIMFAEKEPLKKIANNSWAWIVLFSQEPLRALAIMWFGFWNSWTAVLFAVAGAWAFAWGFLVLSTFAQLCFLTGDICLLVMLLIHPDLHGKIDARRSFSQRCTVWAVSAIIIGALAYGQIRLVALSESKLKEAGSSPPIPQEETLKVAFRTQFVNTSRRLDSSDFWVIYFTASGATISPVALLTFLDVTSTYARPITISSYSMEIQTRDCDWVKLVTIPTGSHSDKLLWGMAGDGTQHNGTDFHRLHYVKTTPSFEDIWEAPIEPFGDQFGTLTFDSPSRCDLGYGDHLRLRLTLVTSAGGPKTVTSPDLFIQKFGPMEEDSTGRPRKPTLYFTGTYIDASKACRRSYSGASVMDRCEKGIASTFRDGNPVSVVPEDGTFLGVHPREDTPKPKGQ